MDLTNCTIANNLARDYGGGIVSNYKLKLLNCILWDNSDVWMQSEDELAQINAENPIINYSCVQGWTGTLGGIGNIDIDPEFADLNNDDYHLKSTVGRWDPNNKIWVQDNVTSPCVDAGDPNIYWGQELWPHGGRINMGAYGGTSEASMSLSDIGDARDLNNDDLITWDDVLLLVEKWDSIDVPLKQDLNLDGVVDVNDLLFYDDWSTDSNNAAPEFDSIEDQYISTGKELNFTVSAIDTDSDELAYKALGLPEGAEFSGEIFSWAPEQTGTYLITFIVSDYKSLDYMTVKIIVEER